MKHSLLLSFLAVLPLLPAQEPPLVAPSEPRTPEEQKKLIKLPPGFELQLVAAETDIAKPMNLAFDAKGRLWVTSSLEYPFPAQGRPGRDMVHVLEDFAPDGKARKISLFAKDLNIPIGILPRKDGAIVYSINSIDYLRGPVGQLYQKRDTLYGGFGYRDTHGMVNSLTLGYDGWVYACHGYANDSATKGTDGHELRMNSGNVFRFKPDGSRIEIFTRGQVNPFGLCFDEWGNLYSADCHTKPITQLIRGAHYDSFGKPHDGLGYGPNMMGHLHDSTGLCGLVYYDADQFPPQYRKTLFVCNPVTSRINHDKLAWKGSTPEAVLQPDFLISNDPWCRPVYMTLGPDGAIYFADFYNRIIGHYEVPLTHPGRDRTRGRIWRIVYKGADAKGTPPPHGGDLTAISVPELIKVLDHPNITVRMFALHELVDRGEEASKAIRARLLATVGGNRHAFQLWALHRLGSLTSKDLMAEGMLNNSHFVRIHTMKMYGERKQTKSEETIDRMVTDHIQSELLNSGSHRCRAAAEVLGIEQVGSLVSVRNLIYALVNAPRHDTHLHHAIRIALRNQIAALPSNEFDELCDSDLLVHVADVAPAIHSERGGTSALRFLQTKPAWNSLIPKLVQHATRYQPKRLKDIQALVKTYSPELPIRAALTQAVVQGIREASGTVPPEVKTQAGELAKQLCTHADPKLIHIGIDLCSNSKLTDQFDLVLAVLEKPSVPPETLIAAAATLVTLDATRAEPPLFRVLASNDAPMPLRDRAANLLAGLNRPTVRAKLLETLTTVPSRLANVIAYNLANSRPGAEELLQAVEQKKLPASILLTTSVQSRILNHRNTNFRDRYAKLTQGLPPADVRLAELVQQRTARFKPAEAKADLGAKLFTQHCANCHQIAGQGSKIAPQLDGVGIRGTERLLEDILDPNRNVDHAFRASVLVLTDGRTLTGLPLREEGNLVVIADAQGKEQKIAKTDIDERKETNLSPMPATFDAQLTEAEMNHLLAYLLTQQAKK
jgi:putative heme-binding domain-containing protein